MIYMQRGTPTSRSFFSPGLDVPPRTPTDVSWIREQAGTTPRALDRDFLGASPASEMSGGGAGGGGGGDRIGGAVNTRGASNGTLGVVTGYTTRGKMYNRRTWTKEENDQLQEGMAALGGPNAEFGRNVSECVTFVIVAKREGTYFGVPRRENNAANECSHPRFVRFTVYRQKAILLVLYEAARHFSSVNQLGEDYG